MSRATLTPFDLSVAKKVSKRVYRKQILPLGSINYKGQKITFDKAFLTDLATSFKKGAYDQVPLQFATNDNQHNMDPEKYRGEITALELTATGLDAVIHTTAAGAKAIADNPKMGVSARIVQGLEKADGRKYGRAIQHVLATLDPRVTRMGPWEAISLSETDVTEVVDLTAETYKKGPQMATKAKAKGTPKVVSVKTTDGTTDIDLSALSDEEFQALLDLATEGDEETTDEDAPADTEDGVVDVTDELDEDDEDESEEDEDESDDDDEEEDEEEDEEVELSTDTITPPKAKKAKVKKAKAATVPATTDLSEIQVMRRKIALDGWKQDRREFARAGVPPFILDLAAPILSLPDSTVIDLSDSTQVDANDVIRKMLDGIKGVVDLAPEIGHAIDLADDDDKPDAEKSFLDAWDHEYGPVR